MIVIDRDARSKYYTAILSDSEPPCEPTYDADGNLLSWNGYGLEWNSENSLCYGWRDGSDFGFFRDWSGRAFSETDGADYTDRVFDGWNPVFERTFDGLTETPVCDTVYVWGADLSGTMQGAGGVGGPLAVKRDGAWYAPLYDANGNVTAYVSETGAVVAEYEYDAFGATISQSGAMADAFRHRFSTKPWIAALGAYDYGERLYSPELRRWLSRDPIGEEGGLNLYVFCNNNSLRNIDRLGTTTIAPILESFFSRTVSEPMLWVMGENDEYTTIVRNWESVKNQLPIIKSRVARAPRIWSASHTTSPTWRPQMRYGFDPRSGYEVLVSSPPGTDPITARNQYIIYWFTTIRTDSLHTSAIGSYRLAATVDTVTFNPCRATINIWMYNEMSRRSFGQYANHWYFRGRPMPSQFMWWNWKERIKFDSKGRFVDDQ